MAGRMEQLQYQIGLARKYAKNNTRTVVLSSAAADAPQEC